jgi:hypothetical protein
MKSQSLWGLNPRSILSVVRKERVLWVSLALKVLLFASAILTTHWLSGDSRYYLDDAGAVCGGSWGGAPLRSPFYSWFLCAFSPAVTMEATRQHVFLPLALQALAVWACGFWLFRQFGPWVAAFWLFDPGLLIYSGLIMSDALFAVGVLFLAVSVYRFSEDPTRSAWPLGLALGLCVLMRSIGQTFVILTVCYVLLCLVFWAPFRAMRRPILKRLAVALLIAAALVAPRVAWNISKHRIYAVQAQGSGWLHTVAAAVEYHGTGIDFIQSELLWAKARPLNTLAPVAEVFLRKPGTWAFLSAKGVARVLFGHVNSEWSLLLFGEPPIGPGWFKAKEQRQGWELVGWQVVPWILGILATALFCAALYMAVAVAARRAGAYRTPFFWWSVFALALLAGVPMVFGDARFRMGIWPIAVFALGVFSERARASRPARTPGRTR